MTPSVVRRELLLVSNTATATQTELEGQGFRVLAVDDCGGALQVIRGHPFDAVLVDMECSDQVEFLRRLHEGDPPLQVLIVSEAKDEGEVALDVCIDRISRSASSPARQTALHRAVEVTRLRRENLRLRRQLAEYHPAPTQLDDGALKSSVPINLSIGGDAELAAINRAHVMAVLAQHHGNKAQTARALGINRRSLYRLLGKYNT